MKKVVSVVMMALLVLAVSGISLAAHEPEETKASMTRQEMKGGKEMQGKCGMMMKKMSQRKMIATEDGGVAVLAGNKLMKYDKKLNLVNEVKIDTGMEKMRKMMQEKGKCPVCGGTTKEDSPEE